MAKMTIVKLLISLMAFYTSLSSGYGIVEVNEESEWAQTDKHSEILIHEIEIRDNCAMEERGYYLVYVEGEENLEEQFIEWTPLSNNKEGQVHEMFEKIQGINYNEKQVALLPVETEIMNVTIQDSHCTILFSKDILAYGGTAYEYYLINQLAYNFLSIDGIDHITFRIAERGTLFVEGGEVVNLSRDKVLERMKRVCVDSTKEK